MLLVSLEIIKKDKQDIIIFIPHDSVGYDGMDCPSHTMRRLSLVNPCASKVTFPPNVKSNTPDIVIFRILAVQTFMSSLSRAKDIFANEDLIPISISTLMVSSGCADLLVVIRPHLTYTKDELKYFRIYISNVVKVGW